MFDRCLHLKNEFSSILSKSNTETSQSKIDQVFMILTLINLELEFENIQEQILTGSVETYRMPSPPSSCSSTFWGGCYLDCLLFDKLHALFCTT